MSQDAPAPSDDPELLADLTEAERAELERATHLRKGEEVLWIEPDGTVRREPLSKVYYLQTRRGVFRLSRITKEVVEV